MRLKQTTILELKQILKEEFRLELNNKGELDRLAYSLVGYFDLLAKIDNRHKFVNSPGRDIDPKKQTVLDEKR